MFKVMSSIDSFGSLLPCNKSHFNRVLNYRQNFNELNIKFFDFTNGFKCSVVHIFGKLKNLSIKIFEIIFYQYQNKRKHSLIPIEISKNDSDIIVDLLIYKSYYVPI